MALWLYAASSSKASADRTFALAERHGIVWRSFYANRRPPTPIPNVKHLRPGDQLYLGYRHKAGISLLGRMRIVCPENPLRQSRVFGEIPEAIVPEFEIDYGVDPILNVLVGISVDEVVEISGRVASPGRLSLTEVAEPFGSAEDVDELELVDAGEPPPTRVRSSTHRTRPVEGATVASAGRTLGPRVGACRWPRRPYVPLARCRKVWATRHPQRSP